MDLSKKIWLNLFARQRFHKFNNRLLRRGLVGLGVNDFGPRQERGEQNWLEYLARTLPQNSVVFDVGAFTGLYSLFLAERRPDLTIHAFEPNPVTYAKLAANTNGKKITTHPFALGEQEGEAKLHDTKPGGGSECSSLVGADVDVRYHGEPEHSFTVPVKRLDRVMKDLGVTKLHYLKVDAEGFDLMVLKGAAPLIEASAIDIVQFEFGPANISSRTYMRDFYQLLPKHSLYRIVQDGLAPLGAYNPAVSELFGLQNIVAVPEGIKNE